MALDAGTVAITGSGSASSSITVTGGVVTVDPSGWFSGSGLALALAQAHFIAIIKGYGVDNVQSMGTTFLQGSTKSVLDLAAGSACNQAAQLASAYGPAIVTHLQSNAVVPAGSFVVGAVAVTGSSTVT